MTRKCMSLKPVINGRRHPFAYRNLTTHIYDTHLRHTMCLIIRYRLHEMHIIESPIRNEDGTHLRVTNFSFHLQYAFTIHIYDTNLRYAFATCMYAYYKNT